MMRWQPYKPSLQDWAEAIGCGLLCGLLNLVLLLAVVGLIVLAGGRLDLVLP